ncbi:glucose-1-phosphate adenylyltransferase [Alteromonadaceae bacterium BrNp21-10]|nr:glucose-1-phosphate adenylyltransferase [Alteromonadaceae bacterium BrNp21-10]
MLKTNSRYISRLTKDTAAIVLAGGRGSRLKELTDKRAKPAVHFGGKFRIIDFPLSNCINSGIRQIGVVTQYKAHSLIRHLVRGWGHFKKELGEYVEILPASQQCSDSWYQGTADSLFQNLDIIRAENPKYILVLAGDQVYKMDYGVMLAEHVEKGADMTVACIEVPVEEAANAFGVMQIDDNGRVVQFTEKPTHPVPLKDDPYTTLASMGLYIFNAEFLYEQLNQDASNSQSQHDFGNNIIPSIIDNHHIHAYRFREDDNHSRPYWRDVGTLDAFWQANMELLLPEPALNIYDEDWPIWTYQQQQPPAKFVFNNETRRGFAADSMVSGGCIISGGRVENSILFSDVRINSYSMVNRSVVLPNVVINRHARIQNAIIDSACHIPEGLEIGFDLQQDKARGFRVCDSGLVLVTHDMLKNIKPAKFHQHTIATSAPIPKLPHKVFTTHLHFN